LQLALGRQDRGGADFAQPAGFRIERERRDSGRQLVQEINEAVVGRDLQMPRPSARLELYEWRRIGGELSGFLVEQELEHLVGAEVRDEDEAVRTVGMYRVRAACSGNHLQRLADPAVGAHRIEANEVGAIRRAEEPA